MWARPTLRVRHLGRQNERVIFFEISARDPDVRAEEIAAADLQQIVRAARRCVVQPKHQWTLHRRVITRRDKQAITHRLATLAVVGAGNKPFGWIFLRLWSGENGRGERS